MVCQNALEVDYSDATVVFLYLIPRGLRLIKSVLLCGCCPTEEMTNTLLPPLCVSMYMTPFADDQYKWKEICVVDHQKRAEWPIYLHTLGGDGMGKEATNKCNENGSSQGLWIWLYDKRSVTGNVWICIIVHEFFPSQELKEQGNFTWHNIIPISIITLKFSLSYLFPLNVPYFW